MLPPHPRRHRHRKIGMIVEGPSGRGKDFLLETVLQWRKFQEADLDSLADHPDPTRCFHHTTAGIGTGYTAVAKAIKGCMQYGAVAIVSEINLLDTHFVQGLLAPQADRRVHPGFLLFATVNPSDTTKGRKAFSSSFLARFLYERVPEWNQKELQRILRGRRGQRGARVVARRGSPESAGHDLITVLVSFHLYLVNIMTERRLTTTPTLRRIVAAVESLPQSGTISQQELEPLLRNLYALQFQITHLSARRILGRILSGLQADEADARERERESEEEKRRMEARVTLYVQMVANLCMPLRQSPRIVLYPEGTKPPEHPGRTLTIPYGERGLVNEPLLATKLAQMAFTRVGPLGLWSGIGSGVHRTELAHLLELLRVRQCCARLLPRLSTRIVAPDAQARISPHVLDLVTSILLPSRGADSDGQLLAFATQLHRLDRTQHAGQLYPLVSHILAMLCKTSDYHTVVGHLVRLLELVGRRFRGLSLCRAIQFVIEHAVPYAATLPESSAEVEIIAASYQAARSLPSVLSQLLFAVYEEEATARFHSQLATCYLLREGQKIFVGAMREIDALYREHAAVVESSKVALLGLCLRQTQQDELRSRAAVEVEWSEGPPGIPFGASCVSAAVVCLEADEVRARGGVLSSEQQQRDSMQEQLDRPVERWQEPKLPALQGPSMLERQELQRCPNCREMVPTDSALHHSDTCMPDLARVRAATCIQRWYRKRAAPERRPERVWGGWDDGMDWAGAANAAAAVTDGWGGDTASDVAPCDAEDRPDGSALEPVMNEPRLLRRVVGFLDAADRAAAQQVSARFLRAVRSCQQAEGRRGADEASLAAAAAMDAAAARREEAAEDEDPSTSLAAAVPESVVQADAPTSRDFYRQQAAAQAEDFDLNRPPMIRPAANSEFAACPSNATYESYNARIEDYCSVTPPQAHEVFAVTLCDTLLSGGKFVSLSADARWFTAGSGFDMSEPCVVEGVVRVRQQQLQIARGSTTAYTLVAGMHECKTEHVRFELTCEGGPLVAALRLAGLSTADAKKELTAAGHRWAEAQRILSALRGMPQMPTLADPHEVLMWLGICRELTSGQLVNAIRGQGIDPTAATWSCPVDEMTRTRDGRWLAAMPPGLLTLWEMGPAVTGVEIVLVYEIVRSRSVSQPWTEKGGLDATVGPYSVQPTPTPPGRPLSGAETVRLFRTYEGVLQDCTKTAVWQNVAKYVASDSFRQSERCPSLVDCRRLAVLRGPAAAVAAFRMWFSRNFSLGTTTTQSLTRQWLSDQKDTADILSFVLRRCDKKAAEDVLVRLACVLLRWVLRSAAPVILLFGWSGYADGKRQGNRARDADARKIVFGLWNTSSLLVLLDRRWHNITASCLHGYQTFAVNVSPLDTALPPLGTRLRDRRAESSIKGKGTLKWDTLATMQDWIWGSLQESLRDELFDERTAFVTRFARTHGRVNLRRLAAGRCDFFEQTVLSTAGARSARPIVLLGYPAREHRLCAVELDFWRLVLEAGFIVWVCDDSGPTKVKGLADLSAYALSAKAQSGGEEARLQKLREAGVAPEAAVVMDVQRLGVLLFRVADVYCSVLRERLHRPSDLDSLLDPPLDRAELPPAVVHKPQQPLNQLFSDARQAVELELRVRSEAWMLAALGQAAQLPRLLALTILPEGWQTGVSHGPVQQPAHHLRNLRRLCLTRTPVSSKTLTAVLARMPALEQLRLCEVRLHSDDLSTAESTSLDPSPCVSLSELCVSDCSGIERCCLTSNHRLRTLRLSGCGSVHTLDLMSQVNLEEFNAFSSSSHETSWDNLRQVLLPALSGLRDTAKAGIASLLSRAPCLRDLVCWSALDCADAKDAVPASVRVGVVSQEQRSARSCFDHFAQGIAVSCPPDEMVREVNYSLRLLCLHFLESLGADAPPDIRSALAASRNLLRRVHRGSPLMSGDLIPVIQDWVHRLLELTAADGGITLHKTDPWEAASAVPAADCGTTLEDALRVLSSHCSVELRPFTVAGSNTAIITEAFRKGVLEFLASYAVVQKHLRSAVPGSHRLLLTPSCVVELLLDLRVDGTSIPELHGLLRVLGVSDEYALRRQSQIRREQMCRRRSSKGPAAA
eukprot:TRINITY_DN3172_c1_g1_i1.p1 TRINITY_DN3172_c1_g1~~TRINITY_DN3172_c1_g1_i1.p1  ORF type:complete len:2094 (+),score=644.00 TRINITY_DN3172_c1_g1_i1:4470-10751(+)